MKGGGGGEDEGVKRVDSRLSETVVVGVRTIRRRVQYDTGSPAPSPSVSSLLALPVHTRRRRRGEVRRPSVRSIPRSPLPAGGISRSAPAGRPRGRWSGHRNRGPALRRGELTSFIPRARRPGGGPPAPVCIRPSPARRGPPSPSSAPTPGAPIFFLLPGSPRRRLLLLPAHGRGPRRVR
ncbi:hypothetical protein ZWY2020_046208 [Hordeum vulgare]|nr:hypothetical protein ZWY2020_046208 [Hordeum vulgare]